MEVLALVRCGLTVSAAALLAACGGSQPPIGAPGTATVSTAHAQQRQVRNAGRGTGTMEFAYVANHYSDNVSVYAIDAGTGALTQIKGSPFATGYGPYGVAIDRSGKFAYVANNGTASGKPGSVSAFTISPRTGALVSVQGSPFTAGTNPLAAAISPDGKYLYVVNYNSSNVSIFAINARTGALKGVKRHRTRPLPTAETIDPMGKFAYMTSVGRGNPYDHSGRISGYAINSRGALTKIKGSGARTGDYPVSAVSDPSGEFLYVVNFAEQTVSGYAITASTGNLRELQGSPFYTDFDPGAMAIDPNGSFAYVAADLDVDAYTITADGGLTPVSGSPFPGGYLPDGASIDPLGKFLYVANINPDNDISAYAINPSTGALTQVQGSPFAAGQSPAGIATCEIEHDRCIPSRL
jgi:6-phosphogluconolactonase